MSSDALPNDLDSLRALVARLASEHDAAIAEGQRLSEQNHQLWHLLKQLQRAQFGRRSERLDPDQIQLSLAGHRDGARPDVLNKLVDLWPVARLDKLLPRAWSCDPIDAQKQVAA